MSFASDTIAPQNCRAPFYLKDAGGSRTHFELLCRQSPCRLASASERRPPDWRTTRVVQSLKVVVTVDPIKSGLTSGSTA